MTRSGGIRLDRLAERSSDGRQAISWFGSRYYNECHALFRSLTDQPQRMLEDVSELCAGRPRARILSVGSGTGLFEIPMLERLLEEGFDVATFVGIDVNHEACAELARRLTAGDFGDLDWRVLPQAFETYAPVDRFQILLFNHSFEYLAGPPARWVRKALSLLTDEGVCLIYSPDRGGINAIYAEVAERIYASPPSFSDDLQRALDRAGIAYSKRKILGMCSVEPLERSTGEVERTQLLSFLCQLDCRGIAEEQRAALVDHYLGLRVRGDSQVPHPTTRFLIPHDHHAELGS